MAAKFVVFALAVASASANCLSSYQQESLAFDQCGSAGQTVTVQSAPRVELVQSAPRVELVQSAPSMQFVQSAPVATQGLELLQSSPVSSQGLSFLSGGSLAGVTTGPQISSANLPVVQAPPVTLNAVESPLIRLPSAPVPRPRVIRHQCYCTKTVVRPQVVQRTITVPRIQRYLKQSYKPIVENVAYQARPVGNDARGQDIVISGSSSGLSQGVTLGASFGSSLGSSLGFGCQGLGAQQISIPVQATQQVSIPVQTQQVSIPVQTQEVVRSPVNLGFVQDDCQCEQQIPRCY